MPKHKCCLVFVFWNLQNKKNNNIQIQERQNQTIHDDLNLKLKLNNPARNIVWEIYWFLFQPIHMNFSKQYLENYHASIVLSVSFHPTLPYFVSCSKDKTVILFNLTTSHHVFSTSLKITIVLCMMFLSILTNHLWPRAHMTQ